MNNNLSKTRDLQGKKVLITAWDLEQLEHRGIANYSKNLIYALKGLNAEVWILTQFSNDIKLKSKYREEKKKVEITRILGQFTKFRRYIYPKKDYTSVGNRIILFANFILRRHFWKRRLKFYKKKYFIDNPLLKTTQLEFLNYVDGIISAKNIYFLSALASRTGLGSVRIELQGFDAFIRSCPLHIKGIGVPKDLNSIHDVIPILTPSPDNALHFYRRLKFSFYNGTNIFISKHTKIEYEKLFENRRHKKGKYEYGMIIQPPSLRYSKTISQAIVDNNISQEQQESIDNLLERDRFNFNSKILYENQFIIFNSSIEERKNVEAALKSFTYYSGKYRKHLVKYKVCVIGKLKKDKYCNDLESQYKSENIIFTDFIDEKTKLLLYLNARAFICPSYEEGFGIPVLDAAAMGIHSIVSDIRPHIEIYDIKDFKNYVNLIPTENNNAWYEALENIFINEEFDNFDKITKLNRLKRFCLINSELKENFKSQLEDILTN